MSNNRNKEFYLAKWMSGDLSDSDLQALVRPEDYTDFLLIRESLAGMKSPNPDFDSAYKQLQGQILSTNYIKKRSLKITKMISIAASVLILIALGFYDGGLFGQKEYSTTSESKKISFGENVAVTLDQNTIINQKAPLYNTKSVYLKKGEAYFEVVTGTHFSIITTYGIVEVLGTKFTVQVNKDLFEVKCFEGRVKVNYNDSIYYVDRGTSFNSKLKEVKNLELNYKLKPDWLIKYKKFNQTDLVNVLDFIEKNYDVHIDYPNRFIDYKFTGTIPMDNLEDALNLVCYSFNLKFKLHNKNVIIKK